MKILRRTASLIMAFLILACTASCGTDGNDDEEYYYPVTKECFYSSKDELYGQNEYEYSPEGYLISEKQSGYYYVKATKEHYFGEKDVKTYGYDEYGRMISQYHGFEYANTTDKGSHYRKDTTTYCYDDRGRLKSAYKSEESFIVLIPSNGFGDDNLDYESETVYYYGYENTDIPETGGWETVKTEYNFTGEREYYEKSEYDADGRLLQKTENAPMELPVCSMSYSYDDIGRPISVYEQTFTEL